MAPSEKSQPVEGAHDVRATYHGQPDRRRLRDNADPLILAPLDAVISGILNDVRAEDRSTATPSIADAGSTLSSPGLRPGDRTRQRAESEVRREPNMESAGLNSFSWLKRMLTLCFAPAYPSSPEVFVESSCEDPALVGYHIAPITRLGQVPKMFYAITRGHNVGVYDNWPRCKAYVLDVKGSAYSGHTTREMAIDIFKEALQFGGVALIPYPATDQKKK
ncbi:hypothetical protein CERSUDRAFT_90151 [Gelatoporia subvermispora B]|uniref:Ribonuclease H1 N-terminal domain-containing protein n=1 Tax=Ceriporiopsis subvermispora (strain B) TaxID=914234 RepID=M2RT11_CERS8|nr:hypothetical protein CERSUDRAFT_90151 [Gelatoporia subvermispora B]